MYLIQLIQYQQKQICWLLNFICRYIPLKQWAFDDSHSPKYQKFKIDKLPKIIFTRNGITMTTFLISNGSMARRSNLSIAVLIVTSVTTVPVLVVMHLSLISIRTTAPKDRFCAKFAQLLSLQRIIDSLNLIL